MGDEAGKELGEMDRNRYQQMISLSFDVFNRQNTNIHALITRTSILLGFSLATLTFITGLIYSSSSEDYLLGEYSTWTFHSFWLLMIVSIIICLIIFHPKEYQDYDLYKPDDFKKIYNASEEDLYNDIIAVYKKIFEENEKIYKSRINLHLCNIWIFSGSCILSFLTFLLIIFWGI